MNDTNDLKIFILLVVFWGATFFLCYNAVATSTVFNFNTHQKRVIASLLPQGWNFFTKNPREPLISFYVKKDSGSWMQPKILSVSNSDISNLFGIKRNTRAHGIEGGVLYSAAFKYKPIKCQKAIQICLEKIKVSHKTKNFSPHSILCGKIAIVLEDVKPWAWSRFGAKSLSVNMPSKIYPIEAIC